MLSYGRHVRRSVSNHPTLAVVGIVLAVAVLFRSAEAQQRFEARVNVDAAKTRNIMAFRALAADAVLWDEKLMDDPVPALLQGIGTTTLRYPGAQANRYHWSLHKSSKSPGAEGGKPEYYAPDTDFGRLVNLLDKFGGSALITVNYGSNLQGTGGGEPAEAAAWVAYANGDPSDKKGIGKDSAGNDWKTVGYWAALRASAPLPTDDGYNFLRITHLAPLKIRYWVVGDEPYSNGYYMKNGQYNSEDDLHAPYGKDAKEDEKLRNSNAKLSPQAYGNNVVAFVSAMKAVDPTIKVGAVLIAPPVKEAITKPGAHFERWNGEGSADNLRRMDAAGGWVDGVSAEALNSFQTDWNPGVMKACGKMIDFVSIHWRAGKASPQDWKQLDVPELLDEPRTALPQIVGGLLDLFTKYGGANAGNIQLAVSGVSINGTPADPFASTLFLTDTYASLIEDGALAIVGSEVHNPHFLDAENRPGQLAYAMAMIHLIARPNDPMIASDSNNSLLAVHATKRTDGSVGLLLINKDPAQTAAVKVNLKSANVASKAMRVDYGKSTSGKPATSAIEAGNSFTLDIPPYTMTAVVLQVAKQ